MGRCWACALGRAIIPLYRSNKSIWCRFPYSLSIKNLIWILMVNSRKLVRLVRHGHLYNFFYNYKYTNTYNNKYDDIYNDIYNDTVYRESVFGG